MSVTGKPSADGTVQVHCPRTGCTATLRVKPKTARTWVTCAADGCGHRFVLEVPEPAAAAAPPVPPPMPVREPKETFDLRADDGPQPPRPNKPRAERSPRRRMDRDRAGSSNMPLIVGGIAAFVLLAGGVAAVVVYAMRDKGSGPANPTTVAQNQTPAAPGFQAPVTSTTIEAVRVNGDPTKPKPPATGVKPAASPKSDGPAVESDPEPSKTDPDPPSEAAPPKKGPKKGLGKGDPVRTAPGADVTGDAKDAIERVKKSTALIEVKGGWGTGFVIRPGIVMTNFHVIGGAPLEELKVSFVSLDDTAPAPLKPTLLFCDPRRDLAILKVDTDRSPLEMCPSGTELTGLTVAVVGNPRGDGGQAVINKVTTGSLAAPVRRNAEWTYFELRAEAFFGNSGGPVVDVKTGKLVGVMQSILGDGKNKSYCIPYGEATRALDRLPASKEQEPAAARVAAARHALDFANSKLPIIERNASLGMKLQLNILEFGAANVGVIRDDGQQFTAAEIMSALKETHAKTYAQLTKLESIIAASPQTPSALRSALRLRIESCGSMRALAEGKTETKNAFVKHMDQRKTASDRAIKSFQDEYTKFLDNMDKAKGK